MQLTEEQGKLLAKINQYSDTNRRTDRLAVCMTSNYGDKWDASHVAFVGLHLRSLGCVTSTKDNAPYARWDITTLGKAALAEHLNVKVSPGISKNEAPVTVSVPPDYWVKCKGDNTVLLFSSYAEAEAKAKVQAVGGRNAEVFEVRKVASVRQTIEVSKS